jgi:hypothetical protein
LEYFKHSRAEKIAYLGAFQNNESQFCHFSYDINERSLTLISPDQAEMHSFPDAGAAADSAGLANSLLAELENYGKARAIYSLIKKRLPPGKIDEQDLTMSLTSATTGKPVIISLVDYLDAITTPGKVPERRMLQFHTYVKKRVQIPLCFVLNKHFH